MSLLSDIAEIAVGGAHACARRSAGGVACWGRGGSGELGDGALTNSMTPVAVYGLADAVEIAAGGQHMCTRRSDGSLSCWGLTGDGALGSGGGGLDCHSFECSPAPWPVIGIADAVELAAGSRSTCARRASGQVLCWGANELGQVGDGTTTMRSTPVPVVGL